jgi:phosphatidylglycerophosphate synthase
MSRPPVRRWLLSQSVLWTAGLAAAAWGTIDAADASAVLWGVLVLAASSYPFLWRALGTGRTAADRVTLARFLGLLAFLALVARTNEVTWTSWLLAAAAVASDLLDGWTARRFGGSEAGAVLDMETDQLATLVLSVVAAIVAGAGAWVLLLPAFRYAFALSMTALGLDPGDPRPVDGDNRRGRLVCASVMTLLLVCLAPPLAAPARFAASGAAVLLLGWSFASDAAHLVRRSTRRASSRASRATLRPRSARRPARG